MSCLGPFGAACPDGKIHCVIIVVFYKCTSRICALDLLISSILLKLVHLFTTT